MTLYSSPPASAAALDRSGHAPFRGWVGDRAGPARGALSGERKGAWPEPPGPDGPFSLLNVRIPACCAPPALAPVADGLVATDLTIRDGRVHLGRADGPCHDLAGAMVWPCTVDCHTHIDKGQVWARSPNTDGTFASALNIAPADAEQADAPDLHARASFMLQAAYAHGTAALRSHVDAAQPRLDRNLGVLTELAQDWAGRVDLRLAPFTGMGEDPGWIAQVAARAAETHGRTLSLFVQMGPDLDAFLDAAIALADRYTLALDVHADETLDPGSHCLDAVARAVLRTRFQGPVLVGHCCALSVQSQTTAAATLDRVALAGIAIVALPLCNAYLMGRQAALTPLYRATAPVHEARARGIPVALGSDNVRDAFHAYGDLDAVELFRDALRWMHLDHPVGDWPSTVTATPAGLIGCPELGRIRDGGPADLILLEARNWSEFAARPVQRTVLRAGKAIDTTPPDFRDLDGLKGMCP